VFADWALSWRYGGGRTGYGESGMALYREFIERKYKTIQALNEAYGTDYPDWQSVPPPLPPENPNVGAGKRNKQPKMSRAYEDFMAMKSDFLQEYFEGFLARDFRKIDPWRPLCLYYYADVETGYERPTPDFFKNNPGIIQRNGGNEIAGTWNKQYMYFRAYENTPTMSEDNAVYADTEQEWASNFFNGLQIGKWGANFFNYSYLAHSKEVARKTNGQRLYGMDHHRSEVVALFQNFKTNALPVLTDTARKPPGVAIYYGYEGGSRPTTTPGDDLFFSRYLAEPINDRFMDRLAKYYKILFLDSGSPVIPETVQAKIVEWVKSGGTLVMTPETGAWSNPARRTATDDSVSPSPESAKNELLDALGIPLPPLGKWGVGFREITVQSESADAFPNTRDIRFRQAGDTFIFPTSSYSQGKVLARYATPTEIAGQPAVFLLTVGKGRVLLLPAYPLVKSQAFYDDLLPSLGVQKQLSFRKKDTNTEPEFHSVVGYILEKQDGTNILMMQRLGGSVKFSDGSTGSQDDGQLSLNVLAYGLNEGSYEVFDLMGGNRSLGVYTAAELSSTGVPAEFNRAELKVYRISKK